MKTMRRKDLSETSSAYVVTGGGPVIGSIRCLGAKNFITKAMVASVLGETTSRLSNVPAIGDTEITRELLASIGVTVEWEGHGQMSIDPSTLSSPHVPLPQTGSNRVPLLLLAALLPRFPEGSVPVLGGGQIGARSVDVHLAAIDK